MWLGRWLGSLIIAKDTGPVPRYPTLHQFVFCVAFLVFDDYFARLAVRRGHCYSNYGHNDPELAKPIDYHGALGSS